MDMVNPLSYKNLIYVVYISTVSPLSLNNSENNGESVNINNLIAIKKY